MSPRGDAMPVTNAHHARVRTVAVSMAAAIAILILPTVAHASHVETVSITPAGGTVLADVCGPFLVQTQGGTDPIGALVDVEVEGTTLVEFCLPDAGVNPVLIDPATGDLGNGTNGTIGGEAAADAGALPGEGEFTFGIVSPVLGSFDITVFVEEPGGPNDNDDPDEDEPEDTASLTIGSGGGGGGDVKSTITISGTFEGKVRSSDAACKRGRTVIVKRVKSGPDRVVGQDFTNDSGAYRVSAQNPSGRFYALVTRKAGGASSGGKCLKARSKKVRR
jgi:hypothetical protein